jgi:hypothetical protein
LLHKIHLRIVEQVKDLCKKRKMLTLGPIFAAIVLATFALLHPFSSRAETLEGQFDWSTSVQELTIPGGIVTVPLSGTATFVYDTVANNGSIFNFPEIDDPLEDTNYAFSTYFSVSNTPQGSDYAFPATSFADLTTYQDVLVNGQPATTFWIISPSTPPGLGLIGSNPHPEAAFSGAYIEDEIFVLNSSFELGLIDSGGDITYSGPSPFLTTYPIEGTYSNLVQIIPEPGTVWMLVVGVIALLVAKRKSQATTSLW